MDDRRELPQGDPCDPRDSADATGVMTRAEGGRRARLRAGAAALAIALSAAGPAQAQDDPAYPAATCAALWMAHARTLGPGEDPGAFREAAVRLSGDTTAVDAFIATQTLRLVDLIHAYVDLSDQASRRLFESLLLTCETFAAETLGRNATQPKG